MEDFIWKLGFTDKSIVCKKIIKTTALGKSKTNTQNVKHKVEEPSICQVTLCLILQP